MILLSKFYIIKLDYIKSKEYKWTFLRINRNHLIAVIRYDKHKNVYLNTLITNIHHDLYNGNNTEFHSFDEIYNIISKLLE